MTVFMFCEVFHQIIRSSSRSCIYFALPAFFCIFVPFLQQLYDFDIINRTFLHFHQVSVTKLCKLILINEHLTKPVPLPLQLNQTVISDRKRLPDFQTPLNSHSDPQVQRLQNFLLFHQFHQSSVPTQFS